MAPIEPHWVCAACERTYAAEPLRCECGARALTRVELDVGGMDVRIAGMQAAVEHLAKTRFPGLPAPRVVVPVEPPGDPEIERMLSRVVLGDEELDVGGMGVGVASVRARRVARETDPDEPIDVEAVGMALDFIDPGWDKR